MDVERLKDLIIKLLEDKKGEEILPIDLRKKVDFADYFLLCSAHSTKHAQGLADYVILELEKIGIMPLSVEGMEQGNWIVLDYGSIVVHIFYEPIRKLYNLEELWLDLPQRRVKKLPQEQRDSLQSSSGEVLN
ncbi:MAG: ribosome silencing factor [Thermodesulfobacterium sp.]|jgi:ribosome-associated protein|nr:ribosome silencing factor [Thermodesulfobacterium sp.]